MFGCGIGHSQNRIGQGRREHYVKWEKKRPLGKGVAQTVQFALRLSIRSLYPKRLLQKAQGINETWLGKPSI